MNDMQGTLRVRAVIVDDEHPALMVDLPNGASFALGREECLAFCFTALSMLKGMYASQEELNAAVLAAQTRVAPVPQGPPQ
jgi:hypothetical protein